MDYYVIKIDKNTGIFRSWKECEANVKGYPGTIFKKFKTKTEAESYLQLSEVKNNNVINNDNNKGIELKKDNNELKIVTDEYDFSLCINIYTDGSCINNRKESAIVDY